MASTASLPGTARETLHRLKLQDADGAPVKNEPRLRCNINPDRCYSDFIGTKRIDGRVTAYCGSIIGIVFAVGQLLFDHFVRALIRCETEIGRLPVGGGDQTFGHQQEGREDQGVDNRDRDHASGKSRRSSHKGSSREHRQIARR